MPRIAPIPRSAMRAAPGRPRGRTAEDIVRRAASRFWRSVSAVGRALGVLPVLEVLGIIALFFLLAQ